MAAPRDMHTALNVCLPPSCPTIPSLAARPHTIRVDGESEIAREHPDQPAAARMRVLLPWHPQSTERRTQGHKTQGHRVTGHRATGPQGIERRIQDTGHRTQDTGYRT